MPIDPCGLAIGVVGLASLFKTCVECFEYVDAGRNYGRDYEILLTKLEVEKTRFLIWGDTVGVLKLQNNGRDPQIDHAWVIPIVEKILGSIQAIFHDARKIGSRYGLRPLPLAPVGSRTPARLSANLMNRCRESYMKFLLRADRAQQETSTAAKFRWAICDRSKFQVMISDLRELIDGLMDITPSVHSEEQKVVQEQIDSLSDIASLQLLQEACADSYRKWSETASMRIARDREEGNVVKPFLNIDDAQHYSEIDQEWYEHRNKQLQEEIVALQARVELMETFPLSNLPDGDSLEISDNTKQLDNLVNYWAADIIGTRPTSLDAICNAVSVDVGIGLGLIPQDISPMHAQSLLRNAMFEAISDGVVNILSITNCPEVDSELTRIHAKLFNADPTAASFWLRCTLSAAAKDSTFLIRNTLREQLPTLASILPSTDDTTILESAVSFSRKLCILSASSNTLYRSFTPGLDSHLDFRTLELAKRCLRTDGGEVCRVGATVCMGLVKVTRQPVPPRGDMEDCTMVVRKARVICDCALAMPPSTIVPFNFTSHDVNHPLRSSTCLQKSKLREPHSENLVNPLPPRSVLSPISLFQEMPLPHPPRPARPPPNPLPVSPPLQPGHFSLSPSPLLSSMSILYPPLPAPSTLPQQLQQQLLGPRPLLPLPAGQTMPQTSRSSSLAWPSKSPIHLRFDQTNRSTPSGSELQELSITTLTKMVFKQMNEISALKAQMMKLLQQPLENSVAETSANADANLPSSSTDIPPPYLRF